MLIFLFLSQILWANDSLSNSLEGRWAQPCQLQTLRTEDFQGDSATLTENYFYKKDCTQPLMSIRNVGTYEFTTTTMDFTFAQITITLKDDLMIQDFNGRNVCGFSDWKLFEERDVTGLSCALITGARPMPISEVGSKRFGIYKIEGDLLYFGRLEPGYDALSPETRPVSFDPRYYIKAL